MLARHATAVTITPLTPAMRRLLALLTLALLLPLPAVQAATITVDSDCSLANAIRSANGSTQTGAQNSCESGDTGADTISLGRDVTLSADTPDITSTITVEGNGRFISGDDQFRIFNATGSSNLTIVNATLRNAISTSEGALLLWRKAAA